MPTDALQPPVQTPAPRLPAGIELDDARLLLNEPDDGSTENALYATTVAQTAQLRDGKYRPIVVLNACESARQSRGFHGLGGFAPAFIRGGAGLFIGTLWSVGDTPALTFIDAFYRSFAVRKPNVAPRQLRDAVILARKATRNGGDGTWMAYAVYGHPRAVVV